MFDKSPLEVAPSFVEGLVARVVKTPDGGLRSEVWKDGSWAASKLPVFEVLDKARKLTPAELSKLGIV
jgi:hypothetical protein